jgi:hypothetical protein
MAHSKGFLQGSCPGTWQNVGRKKDGYRQQKCSQCGRLRRKKVRPCFMFHDWQNTGQPNHGKARQKCGKCAETRPAYVSSCGIFRLCRWHNCEKAEGMHCARCGRKRNG